MPGTTIVVYNAWAVYGALWAGLIKINYTNQIKNKIPLKTLNLQKTLIFKVLINS